MDRHPGPLPHRRDGPARNPLEGDARPFLGRRAGRVVLKDRSLTGSADRALLVVSLLLGAACSRPPPSDRLVLLTERPPITLDPRYAADTASENAIRLVFNGLMRVTERLEFVPDLAESYEAADAKTYLFRLRPGVKFHDGSLLAPEDVVYTYRYLSDEANASPHRGVFRLLDRAEVAGPREVRLTLKEPYAFFLNAVCRPIVPERLARAAGRERFSKLAIGTGPFRLVRFDERAGVELRAFEEHFGGAPKIREVRLKPVLDLNVRLLNLLKGRGDILQYTSDGFPAGALERLAGDPGIRLGHRPAAAVQYLNFNLRHPVLSKLGVRRAIAHAVDRDAIIRHKLRGLARPATGYLPEVHWAYEPDVARYPYDPARAKKLLDEAGFKDPDGGGPLKRFSVGYTTSTNPQAREIAQVIAGQIEEIGIGVNLRAVDFGVLYQDIRKGNFDLYSLQWTGITSPDELYEVFHSARLPPEGLNRNFYADAEVDRLLVEGRREAGRERQRRIYSRVQKIVARDLPALFLWYPEQVAAVRERVRGYSAEPDGSYDALASVILSAE